MNRRRMILALGVLPLTMPARAGKAAAGSLPQPLVAAPPLCRHDIVATGFCPICAGLTPGTSQPGPAPTIDAPDASAASPVI